MTKLFERLVIDIDAAGVAHVQLARPEKRNALDHATFLELGEAGEQLSANNAVRAVVLSGQGPAFCAGIDLSLFADPKNLETLLEHRDKHGANGAQRAIWIWRTLPVPVIAAVHGISFGAGLQLMLGADIRYIDAETRLSIMEIEYGIVPDAAGTQLWKHIVRDDIVRELCYTGRIFNGREAVAMGFATRVSATPLVDALAIAAEIAGKNPHAVRATKRLLNAQHSGTAADGLLREAQEQLALLFSPNQREAVAAKMEKRAPRFADPL